MLEKQGNQEELVLDIGKHEFRFSFDLPNGIPTSFESSNGRIRYWIEGVIDKKMSLDRHTHTTFTVINKHDLNMIPGLRVPTSVNHKKEFYWGPLKSKPVEITFDIQKSKFKTESNFYILFLYNYQNIILFKSRICLWRNCKYECCDQ